MVAIIANFGDIAGESTLSGYENQVDAISIRESIEMPVAVSGGRTRGARTAGQTRYADIELTRLKDVASPKLAEACSSGANLGAVTITMFRTLETGAVPYMTYNLQDVFVSRIEYETLDEQGAALQPHMSDSSNVPPPASTGVAAVAFSNLRSLKGARAVVRPVSWVSKGAYTSLEIERVSVSAAAVSWQYTKYVDGRSAGELVKGWNIQQSIES